jgi:uncharacterized protein with GYD domain
VDDMPMYVGLYKLTAQGAADIKGSPERLRMAMKAWEDMGGTITASVATLGRYDFVGIGEAASDELAALHSAALGSAGSVTCETLRAFTLEEFAALMAKLP